MSPAPAATAPEPPPDPHAKRREEARDWYDEQFFDALGHAKPLDGDEVDRLFAQAEERGYASIPGLDWNERKKRIYGFVLEREPHHPAANRAHGRIPLSDYPDFFAVFRKLTDAKALPEGLRDLRRRYEGKVVTWPRKTAPALEPEEYERVAALLDEFAALDRRLSADPTAKAIFEALERIRIDPLLGQYETVHVEVPPFVLFYGARDLDRAKARALEARLESFRGFVEDYLAFFAKTWIQPLELPAFRPGEILFVWVFGDKESWEHYGKQTAIRPTPGMVGYFNPLDHWVFVYDDRSNQHAVESALAHEMTHQLHWHFSKDPDSEFLNHFGRIDAVWFQEGWAEYVGWTKKTASGYRFAQDSPIRMELFHLCRKNDFPIYPVRELIQRESYEDWLRQVFGDWLAKKVQLPEERRQLAALAELYFGMLYSQAWLFHKFLYEYEDGKYREQALTFTKATLKGYLDHRGARGYARAHEVFAGIFGLSTDADWERFQKEFDRFLEAKLYAVPPPK